MAPWGVVTTVRAPLDVCESFARHYRSIGASHVHLFHDDPQVASIVELDGVSNVICDDAYWKGKRPGGLEMRQRINATNAKLTTHVDWLMHCDIDELCHGFQSISAVLGAQADATAGVTVSSLEAVYVTPPDQDQIFSTPYFKAFFGRDGRFKAYAAEAAEYFGDIAFASKCGFWGHVQGKSFIRTAVDIGKMPLHHKGERSDGWDMRVPTTDIVLRHYDSSSYDLWRSKHMRRISGDVMVPQAGRFRAAQQKLITEAWRDRGEDGLRLLHRRMTCLSEQQIENGLASGFIRVIEPEPHLRAGLAAAG